MLLAKCLKTKFRNGKNEKQKKKIVYFCSFMQNYKKSINKKNEVRQIIESN